MGLTTGRSTGRRLLGATCLWLTLVVSSVASAQVGPGADAVFNREVRRAMHLKQAGEYERAVVAFDRAIEAIKSVSGESYDKGRVRVRYHKALMLIEMARFRDAQMLLEVVLQSPGLLSVDRSVVVERLSFAEQSASEQEREAAAETDRQRAEQEDTARMEGATALAKHQAEADDPVFDAMTWTAAGLGLATLVTAGVLHGLGAADWQQADVAGQSYLEAQATSERGTERVDAAYVLYGVGSALAVTACVLFIVSATSEEPASQEEVSVSVTPWHDGAYAVGTLRF